MHDSTAQRIYARTHEKTGPGKPEPVVDQFIKFVLITKLSLII